MRGSFLGGWVVPAASLGFIWTFYVSRLPNSPYWLDSPELAASAFSLTVSHPPGHPLYATASKIFSFLPLGSIALRMNLFSATCATGALLFVFFTCIAVLTRGFGCEKRISVAFSAIAIVSVGLSPGWVHQATHCEVYAFQAMLMGAVVWISSLILLPWKHDGGSRRDGAYVEIKGTWEGCAAGDGRKARLLGAACFLFSLSLANHPFISLLFLPALAAAITAAAVSQRWPRPGRLLLIFLASSAAGLLVYLYLPIRSNVTPTMIMGRIETLGDLYWTLSAKVYQKSVAIGDIEGMVSKGVGSLFLILSESGAVLPFIALGGYYFMLRERRLLSFGMFALLSTLISITSRVFMPFDRTSPDVTGYMLPILMLQAVAAVGFLGVVSRLRAGKVLSIAAAAGVAAASWGQGYPALEKSKREAECPSIAMFLLRTQGSNKWEPRASVFSSFFSTTFLDLYDKKVLSYRPDVSYTGLPFLGYRGVALWRASTSAEMARVVRGYLITGRLQASDVASMAIRNAVYLEAYPEIPADLIPYMLPTGSGFAVYPQPVSFKDFKASADETNAMMEEMMDKMGYCTAERETKRYLLWSLYNRSLVMARRGYGEGAIRSARLALRLSPGVPQLEMLVRDLTKSPKPILDITPYLPQPPK